MIALGNMAQRWNTDAAGGRGLHVGEYVGWVDSTIRVSDALTVYLGRLLETLLALQALYS